jgi:thioredoxin 1
MKLHTHYALILLLSCAAPAPYLHADSPENYRNRAGALIEATSLQQLQSILASNENVVVDFYATWCGPCKRMAPEFAKLPQAFQTQNIVFVKIEVGLAGSLYNVKMLPTIVCFSNNKETNRTSGFKAFNDLSNYVKSAFSSLFAPASYSPSVKPGA